MKRYALAKALPTQQPHARRVRRRAADGRHNRSTRAVLRRRALELWRSRRAFDESASSGSMVARGDHDRARLSGSDTRRDLWSSGLRATTLNYHDIFTRPGHAGIKVPLPCIMGIDFAATSLRSART